MWSLIGAILAVEHWEYVVGVFGAALVLGFLRGILSRRAARKQQEQIAQVKAAEKAHAEQVRLAKEREEQQERERLARKRTLLAYTSAYEPPAEFGGQHLVYSYPDVEYFVPEYYYARASAVPPHQALALNPDPSNEHDADAVGIYYDGRLVGYMYKNKLRDMAVDFLNKDDRSVMAVSLLWKENKPVMGLYFYRSASYILNAMARRDDAREFELTSNRSADIDTILGN